MGLKGSDTVSLSFEECRVPKSAMLGAPGEGLKIALSALDGGRIGIASQAIGIARSALSAATGDARDRGPVGEGVGYGYIREYPVERHLRDVRVTTIYEGTSEIQRLVISRALCG